jgi:hypothetical protein
MYNECSAAVALLCSSTSVCFGKALQQSGADMLWHWCTRLCAAVFELSDFCECVLLQCLSVQRARSAKRVSVDLPAMLRCKVQH